MLVVTVMNKVNQNYPHVGLQVPYAEGVGNRDRVTGKPDPSPGNRVPVEG